MPIRQVAAGPSAAGSRSTALRAGCEAPVSSPKTRAVDDRVQVARWTDGWSGIEDRDHAVVRGRCRPAREVVGPIDRRAVADVMGARDDDRPDPRLGEPLQLGRDALHGAARLDVGVEQVAGDEEEVDLLGEGEVDGRLEGGELALPLSRRLLTEIVMACAEMHVRGMDDPEHRDAAFLLAVHGGDRVQPSRPGSRTAVRAAAMARARRPHDSPLADSTIGVIVTGTVSRSPPVGRVGRRREWPSSAPFRNPLYPPGH